MLYFHFFRCFRLAALTKLDVKYLLFFSSSLLQHYLTLRHLSKSIQKWIIIIISLSKIVTVLWKREVSQTEQIKLARKTRKRPNISLKLQSTVVWLLPGRGSSAGPYIPVSFNHCRCCHSAEQKLLSNQLQSITNRLLPHRDPYKCHQRIFWEGNELHMF